MFALQPRSQGLSQRGETLGTRLVYPLFAARWFKSVLSKIEYSFALASKGRIMLHYSHLCTNFFQENINGNLTFAVWRNCGA